MYGVGVGSVGKDFEVSGSFDKAKFPPPCRFSEQNMHVRHQKVAARDDVS